MIKHKIEDYIGKKYGMLTIIGLGIPSIGKSGWRERNIDCICDCGNTTTVLFSNVRKGNTTSCGCFFRNNIRKFNRKHGMINTRIYKIRGGILQRCNDYSRKNYGGRGISYDKRWNKFENFFNDMKEGYSDSLSIDRIDNNGDYCKENCRWATSKQQANNKRNNHILDYNGQRLTISQRSEKLGIDRSLLDSRLYKGLSIDRVLKK